MVKKSFINSFYIAIILLISLFTFSLEQLCVLGKNCPLNQGMCVGDFCKCLDGFYSLLDPNLLAEQQTYCNYEQINIYIPLIMETFLPSMGHFYVGKYWNGILKLFLLIAYICTSLILYGTVGVPRYVINLKQKLGISIKDFLPDGLVGEGKEEGGEKDEGTKDENEKENNDEETNEPLEKKNSLSTSVVPIKFLLKTKKEENDKNINRGKFTQIKQAHNKDGDDIFNPEIEETLLEKEENNENEEEEKEEEKNQIILNIYKVSSIVWILWILDLFLYKFKVYNDGNGVPFVE